MAASMMDGLRDFVAHHDPRAAVAVIVDEVNNITNTVAQMTDSRVPSIAGTYFLNDWSNWVNSNMCFVRMDIASSHGLRELKLPSGESDRLRFVGPWPLDVARAALSNRESPIYVTKHRAHDRILHIAGGVIRRLFHCRDFLDAKQGRLTIQALALMEDDSRHDMSEDCSHWVQKQMTPDQQRYVALHLSSLLRGKVSWKRLKGAYDYGLVARAEDGDNAIPVSPVAASVIHQELSKVWRESIPDSAKSSSERGYAFERRMLAIFDPCRLTYKTLFSGRHEWSCH